MRKFAIGGGLVLAALAVAVLSGFGPGGCGHGDKSARHARWVTAFVDDALDDVNANDSQRTAVHKLKDDLLNDWTALRAGHDQAHADALAQWNAPTPDTQQVHALVDGRIDAFRAFAHKAADAAISLHGILTPEQRKQVTAKIEAHKGCH